MVKGQIKMGRKSEEWCCHCGEVFNTKYLQTGCPDCGKIVISCNNCRTPLKLNCGRCNEGSNFKEY